MPNVNTLNVMKDRIRQNGVHYRLALPTKGQPATLTDAEVSDLIEVNLDLIVKGLEYKQSNVDLDAVFARA